MGDGAGDNSIYEIDDEDPVSIIENDDEGTDSENISRKDKERVREKIEELETNLTCETENEDLVSPIGDDDLGHYIVDFPRKDKGKERERIQGQEVTSL